MSVRHLVVSLAVILLAACSGPRNLPPVGTSDQARPATSSGPVPASAGVGAITIQPGDSVWSISERTGVTMPAIIELNRLAPPYLLRVGQVLRLPVGKTYTIVPRDTLYGVSRKLGLSMADIVRLNNLEPPYRLFPGQTLLLPAPVVTAASATALQAAAVSAPGASPPGTSVPQASVPLGTTAQQSAVPLPVARPPIRVAAAPPDGADVAPPQPVPASSLELTAPTPIVAAASPPPPATTPPPATSTPAASPDPGAPPPARSGRFVWPVNGRVALGYGVGDSGLRNDGINITAPRGTSVRVAENGIVVYADDGLRGLGNVVLVRHAEGWVTAYAHVDRTLVSPGAAVRQGQVIATVGTSGSVSTPQLHFQIRKNRDTVDPLSLLPAGA